MYREEYPRPQFVREMWMNLNGSWQFAFDDENKGYQKNWNKKGAYYILIVLRYC